MTVFAVLGNGLTPAGETKRHRLEVEAPDGFHARTGFWCHVQALGQTPQGQPFVCPAAGLTPEQRAQLTRVTCPSPRAGA